MRGFAAACGSDWRPTSLGTGRGIGLTAVRIAGGLSGLLVLGLFVSATAEAQAPEGAETYWHHWRGPNRNGVANTDAPTVFSATENVKWKTAVPGRGFSSPVIWGNRIFLTTAIVDEAIAPAGRRRRGMALAPTKFVVLCYARDTGALLWERVATETTPHEGYHRQLGSFANGSPITDGEHLYVSFGSFGLYAYDFDGTLLWSRDFNVKMEIFNRFGESSSPALHGHTLVLQFDHEGDDSFLVAVDTRTGETLWRQDREEDTSWSSPYIAEHRGRVQVITSAGSYIRSNDLASGEEIWRSAGMTSHPIPTPVHGHGLVFTVSGVNERRIRVISLDAVGDVTGTDAIKWQLDRAAPYNPSPLLWDNELYLVRDGGLRRGTSRFSAFEATTGRPHYLQTRLPSSYTVKASPVGAGDKIYLLTEEGDVIVVKRGPEYEVLAVNSMDEMFLASPAVVDGELFLRGLEHLFCISEE